MPVGTLEKIALEVGKIIAPIEEKLLDDLSLELMEQLGIRFPESLRTDVNFTNALTTSITSIGTITGQIDDLIAAVTAQNQAQIVSVGGSIVNDVRTLIDSLTTLSNVIQTSITAFGSVSQADINQFVSELPSRLIDYTFIRYLEDNYPIALSILELVGIAEKFMVNANSTDSNKPSFVRRNINFNHLTQLFSDPQVLFNTLYGWGGNNLDSNALLTRLSHLLHGLNLPAYIQPPLTGTDKTLLIDILRISPNRSSNPDVLELALFHDFAVGDTINLPVSFGNFNTEISLGGEIEAGVVVTISPPFDLSYSTLVSNSGFNAGISLINMNANGDKVLLFGEAGKSRLDADKITIHSGVDLAFDSSNGMVNGNFEIYGEIDAGELVIDLSEADGFLANILPPEGLRIGFDLKIGFDSNRGFYIEGSSGLEIAIPIHLNLIIIEIETLKIRANIGSGGLPIELTADIKSELGPFKASVQDIGMSANFMFNNQRNGNLGIVDLGFGFNPPNGVGLQIDTSAVKGGGFLYIDEAKGEYAGVAELTIQDVVSLKAIGIINTQLPNGEDGFALLLIITAEFTPIQLGFGFTLNGVGGLVGANRGMNLMAIRDGVRNDTLDHILFPDDPVANAPQIIANLNTVFPISEGNHSFGIMGIIGWGTPTLLEVELGLMITFPAFDIAVIGKLSTALPDKDAAILKLNVAFAGTLSFENKYFYFDAAIFDSKLLTFSLSGSMAVRILWGDEPNFVLSVGGFHPDFVPPPLELNALERITLNLLANDNPRLTLSCYFAVTSNTVQFGAEIDFLFKVSKFKVVGFFYFHALFQFDPFYFIVSIGAGLAVKVGSSTILSVSVSGSLEGPTPWRAKGKGKFKIWIVSFSVSFNETWGESRDTRLENINVYPELEKALKDSRNWQGILPSASTLTTLRDLSVEVALEDPNEDAEDTPIMVHPFGSLSLIQTTVPLDIDIELFGNQSPNDYKRFGLSLSIGGDTLSTSDDKDFFAPAQFFELSDDQKVSRKSYEKYNAGLTAQTTDELDANHHVQKEVAYEMTIMDTRDIVAQKGIYIEPSSQLAHWSKGSAIAKSPIGILIDLKKAVAGKEIKYIEEEFVIVHTSDLTQLENTSVATEFEMQEMLQGIISENPAMEDELLVVSAFEIL